ncbi:TonB-dependent receptor [Rhizorhabdus dicambivorans]|nr:TonB-dependent receptor [Rhizorhabdus dicambivorans]
MQDFRAMASRNRASLKSSTLLTAAALSAAFAAPAFAQSAATAPQAAGEAASIADGSEILVTARRRAERLQDVPVAAAAVNAAQIRQYDMTTLANIRIVAPQISFDRGFTGSGASIALRGVSSSNLDAGIEQSVLLDVDGLPTSRGRLLNDAMFDIQEVTVMKGPQSLFFGKNSPAGVVALKSAGPTSSFEGYARVGYEFTNDQSSIEAAISGPINENWGYRVAIYGSNSEGYIRNQSPGIADPFRTTPALQAGGTFVPAGYKRLGAEKKLSGRLTLAYDNGNGFDATFKLLGSHYSGQGLQSFSEVMGCPAGRTQPASSGRIDPYGDCKLNDRSSQGHLPPAVVAAWPEIRSWNTGGPSARNKSIVPTLSMNYKAGDITLTSVTGLYHYDFRSSGNADATAYTFFWSYNTEKNTSFYQEVRAVSDFEGPLNFAAGGHYENNDRTFTVGGFLGPIAADPRNGRLHSHDNIQDNKSHAFSVFGQLTYKFLDNFELAGGARYTRETKKADLSNAFVNRNQLGLKAEGDHIIGKQTQTNTSPEATLTWRPSSTLMIYGAYKTGYLSGGFSNLGTLAASNNLANVTFGAEKAEGFELGTKFQAFDRALSGSLTAYRYKYKGLQLTALNAVTAVFQTQNAASTITKGIELEGSYRTPMDGLTLRGSVSYNRAEYEDFAGAQCYAGQTAAQGCLPVPGSATARAQDLSGRDVYRAPHWTITGGGVYDIPMSNDYKLSLNADYRWTSGYYASLQENPAGYQKRYLVLNAGARFSPGSDNWSLAVIGRNLTNKRYATIGVDKPGGTGEVFAVAGEPRAVVLQAEVRF